MLEFKAGFIISLKCWALTPQNLIHMYAIRFHYLHGSRTTGNMICNYRLSRSNFDEISSQFNKFIKGYF